AFAARLLHLLDAALEVLCRLLSEALDVVELVRGDGFEELVDRGDTELGVQQDRLLWTEAGDSGQLADARRDHLAKLLELMHRAALDILADSRRHVLADRGDREDGLLVESRDVLRMRTDRAGRLLIGACAERVAAGDLDEVAPL